MKTGPKVTPKKAIQFSYIHQSIRHLAVAIDSLHPDPANARLHSAQNIDAIVGSLKTFGQDQPVVVQKKGMIVRKGNGRLLAAKQLGWTHIAAVIVDEEDIQAIARAIADNQIWGDRMKPHVASAMNLLGIIRQETDAIGVAVSFGKDSLVVLDLCCRLFTRVEAYYLFRVRGLKIVEEWAKTVLRRHGVRVRMYPHFDLSRCYRNAVLQPHWNGLERTPKIAMRDIDNHFRRIANISWVAYGWRRNDSFSRALIMKQCGGYAARGGRVFPLRSWRRQDVLDYLNDRNIPLPPSLGRKEQGGLDFHPQALAELRRSHPEDYEAWLRDFPFSILQEL
jgi:phosphoadenosine phosphosulfate reductase